MSAGRVRDPSTEVSEFEILKRVRVAGEQARLIILGWSRHRGLVVVSSNDHFEKKISLNLPICISSPLESSASSTLCLLI